MRWHICIFSFFCFIWFLLITKQLCKFYAHWICSELYLYLIIGNQADRKKVLSPSELISTICNFHSWSFIPSIFLWAGGKLQLRLSSRGWAVLAEATGVCLGFEFKTHAIDTKIQNPKVQNTKNKKIKIKRYKMSPQSQHLSVWALISN